MRTESEGASFSPPLTPPAQDREAECREGTTRLMLPW